MTDLEMIALFVSGLNDIVARTGVGLNWIGEGPMLYVDGEWPGLFLSRGSDSAFNVSTKDYN